MFEPPVAGNLKPSGDVKMESEARLRSRYRLPLKWKKRRKSKMQSSPFLQLFGFIFQPMLKRFKSKLKEKFATEYTLHLKHFVSNYKYFILSP